jgi:transcription termination/antitermination protein NusA
VDIRSETEFAEEEADMGYSEEEVAGRCAAILANGKRCPNASLPGSRYCGLPAHQALTDTETDYVVPPEDGDEDEQPAEEPGADEAAAPGEEPTAEELVEDAEALETEAEVEDAPEAQEALDAEDEAELDPVEDEQPAEDEQPVEDEAVAAPVEEEES